VANNFDARADLKGGVEKFLVGWASAGVRR
jgi:hypothetical protein